MGARHALRIVNAIATVRNWISGELPEDDASFYSDTLFLLALMLRQIVGWPVCLLLWIALWFHHIVTTFVDWLLNSESDEELMRRRTREAVEEFKRKRAENKKD